MVREPELTIAITAQGITITQEQEPIITLQQVQEITTIPIPIQPQERTITIPILLQDPTAPVLLAVEDHLAVVEATADLQVVVEDHLVVEDVN